MGDEPNMNTVFEILDSIGAGWMDDTEVVNELVISYEIDPGYALACVQAWREEYQQDVDTLDDLYPTLDDGDENND